MEIASRRCRAYEKTVSFQGLLAFKLTHAASETKSHEQSFVTIICESQMHEVCLRKRLKRSWTEHYQFDTFPAETKIWCILSGLLTTDVFDV